MLQPGLPESPAEPSLVDFDELVVRSQMGCADSRNRLASFLHEEFYAIARRLCGGQSFARSLHATNLVNETFLRLIKSGVFQQPQSRRFLFAAAGHTMRQVIADYFRRNGTQKRRSGGQRVYLDQVLEQLHEQPFDFEALNGALADLESQFPRQAEVVQMRFFLGMTIPEIAEKLDVSPSTVESDWRRARVWLYRQLI